MTDFKKGKHIDLSGYKFEQADQDKTIVYGEEMHTLLVAIGSYLSNDPEEWAYHCFVSDMSQIWDFGLEPDQIAELRLTLNLPQITTSLFLYEICELMRHPPQAN